jgi:sulfatase modifying factor 1
MTLRSALAAALVAVSTACGTLAASEVPTDAGPSGAPADGATLDASAPDAAASDGDHPTPEESVDAGGYTIDSTEVTNAAYNAFLGWVSTADAGALVHTFCGFNATFARECSSPDLAPDHPVSCVDWCDAWAYCKWDGKRLCGRIGGEELGAGDTTDPTKSQWMRACAGIDGQTYPYGVSAAVDACQTLEHADGGGASAVRSLAGCEGRPAGLFDMSGNVAEWEDGCDLSGSAEKNLCPVRGGSFVSPAATATCANARTAERQVHSREIGFRCCSL